MLSVNGCGRIRAFADWRVPEYYARFLKTNIMNLIKRIKQFFKPEYTQEWCEPNREEQTQEVKGFKNGKYIKSIIIHYFTEEQANKIKNIDNH